MPDAPTDRELVRRIAGGQREALAKLYDRYADEMMAVAMKFLDDRSLAEEVIHEVFLEIWKNAYEYDADRGSVRAWIMIRMRSRTLDTLDYEGRRDHESIDETARSRPLTSEHDPAEAVDHEWVRQTVDDLPERLREVLVFTYFHDMTGPEIADELDIPVGTVRSRLRSARSELRERAVPDGLPHDE